MKIKGWDDTYWGMFSNSVVVINSISLTEALQLFLMFSASAGWTAAASFWATAGSSLLLIHTNETGAVYRFFMKQRAGTSTFGVLQNTGAYEKKPLNRRKCSGSGNVVCIKALALCRKCSFHLSNYFWAPGLFTQLFFVHRLSSSLYFTPIATVTFLDNIFETYLQPIKNIVEIKTNLQSTIMSTSETEQRTAQHKIHMWPHFVRTFFTGMCAGMLSLMCWTSSKFFRNVWSSCWNKDAAVVGMSEVSLKK